MKLFFKKITSRISSNAPRHIVKMYHFFLALCAAMWYRFPSRHITVIGVTGTKGKTTVVELLRHILEANHDRVASLSSLGWCIDKHVFPNTTGMTMPGRFFLQKFLARAVKQGCAYAIIEVTSQGIDQFRHRFIDVDVGVFTNIAPEHIEAHGGFEPYLRAKLDFFWRIKKKGVAIINRQDKQAQRVSAACLCEKAWYSREVVEYKHYSWPIRNYNRGSYGTVFDVKGHQIKSSLQGDINTENIIAAVATALVLRVRPEAITQGVASVKEIPGRMQTIQQKPFRVIIDYAHTPDSLERVYQGLGGKEKEQQLSLICVLGAAGGGRDIWKRLEFGKIAARYCREIIITNEDPFDESPEHIMEDIAAGVRQAQTTSLMRIVGDRREAIRQAVCAAGEGDIVIITGKGSEPYIRIAHGACIAWNEKEIVQDELERISKKE